MGRAAGIGSGLCEGSEGKLENQTRKVLLWSMLRNGAEK